MIDLNRLAVCQIGAAGGAVAGVGNGHFPRGELLHDAAREHLTDQPQTLVAVKNTVVIDDNAAALLPTVL